MYLFLPNRTSKINQTAHPVPICLTSSSSDYREPIGKRNRPAPEKKKKKKKKKKRSRKPNQKSV